MAGMSLFSKAMADFNRFFDDQNRESRQLVFYSEKGIYLRYYEGLINRILEKSDTVINYLTADIDDPIFKNTNPRIKSYFIQNFEASLFPRLDAKVVVMTLPDLNRFYIKKTKNPVNHVYVFHAIGSTHLQYNFGAFDHYDTIFCVGPHHQAELRKAEELSRLKPKTMIQYGYPYLEKVYAEHQNYLKNNVADPTKRKKVLIAPTWGKTCILETCIKDLIKVLHNTEYEVYIRPHPEFIKRRHRVVEKIQKMIPAASNIKLELDLVSGINVHNADILITDWSGIGFEFAFGTERPVLFIDTPLKIDNPKYKKFGLEPLEIFSRKEIGQTIELSEIANIPQLMQSFIKDSNSYRERILDFRNKYVYHWMNSANIGADYIIQSLKDTAG